MITVHLCINDTLSTLGITDVYLRRSLSTMDRLLAILKTMNEIPTVGDTQQGGAIKHSPMEVSPNSVQTSSTVSGTHQTNNEL